MLLRTFENCASLLVDFFLNFKMLDQVVEDVLNLKIMGPTGISDYGKTSMIDTY